MRRFLPVAPRFSFAVLLLAALVAAGSPLLVAERAPVDYQEPVRGQRGMVVSAHRLASEAGVAMLRQGGNAVDAAVATGFALAVVYPVAGNVGGGGFMVVRSAEGETTTYDYREKAPGAATRTMFQDSTGAVVPRRSRVGALASGVPGAVDGLLRALRERGSLPLEDVLAPAVRLADEGFPLTRAHAMRFNRFAGTFGRFPSTERYFVRAGGWQEGDTLRQADLADVLRRIRDRGRDGFYTGETADLIVAQMERSGGLITHEDLRDYRAMRRQAVEGTYRGYRVLSMPPPSSGGVALVQLLNAVEPYDVAAMGHNSSATVHLMGEVMRRVYADRARWLGDADFYPVPVDLLTRKAYVQRRMAGFDPHRADSSAAVEHGNPYARESTETTHYSVVDSMGNAVSVTTTINGAYGSKLVVDGAGFFLNNEMDDFSAKPGVPNMFGLVGGEANAVEPEKRMLSSMTPTIVEDPDGELFMVVGTPGGATIITTVFQTIVNVVDHGMDVQAAVSAPRVHHQWLPDVLEHERLGLARDVVVNLERRGWTVEEDGTWGRADGITVRHEVAPGGETRRVYLGGADPRGEDAAVGY